MQAIRDAGSLECFWRLCVNHPTFESRGGPGKQVLPIPRRGPETVKLAFDSGRMPLPAMLWLIIRLKISANKMNLNDGLNSSVRNNDAFLAFRVNEPFYDDFPPFSNCSVLLGTLSLCFTPGFSY
jgi:hypothetical protein